MLGEWEDITGIHPHVIHLPERIVQNVDVWMAQYGNPLCPVDESMVRRYGSPLCLDARNF